MKFLLFYPPSAIRTTLNANPKQVREHIMNEVAQILACYRKNCANPSSAGQLVLPECMKLLPLYANCVIRSDSISGGIMFKAYFRLKRKRNKAMKKLLHLHFSLSISLSVPLFPSLIFFVSLSLSYIFP